MLLLALLVVARVGISNFRSEKDDYCVQHVAHRFQFNMTAYFNGFFRGALEQPLSRPIGITWFCAKTLKGFPTEEKLYFLTKVQVETFRPVWKGALSPVSHEFKLHV